MQNLKHQVRKKNKRNKIRDAMHARHFEIKIKTS